ASALRACKEPRRDVEIRRELYDAVKHHFGVTSVLSDQLEHALASPLAFSKQRPQLLHEFLARDEQCAAEVGGLSRGLQLPEALFRGGCAFAGFCVMAQRGRADLAGEKERLATIRQRAA